MADGVNYKTIRDSPPSELVPYYRQLLSHYTNRHLSDALLAGVATDALPPRVLTVWIHGFADNASLIAALAFQHSISVRKTAIRRFALRFREPAFSDLWAAAGGTQGLLDIFAELSVDDVQGLCRAIGRSSTAAALREERQACVSELLMSLASAYLAEAKYANPETRPLIEYYAYLLPACTDDVVETWQGKAELLSLIDEEKTARAHASLWQEDCLLDLESKQERNRGLRRWLTVIHRIPPVAVDKQMSESMRFSLQILQTLEANRDYEVDARYLLNELACPLLRRLEKRTSTSELRADVLKSTLHCLEARPGLSSALELRKRGLLGFAVRLWSRHPGLYENLLITIVETVPLGREYDHHAVLELMQNVSIKMRYPLLQLLLGHLQSCRVRLEDDDQLKGFKNLWHPGMFFQLPKEQARVLLDRLVRLKPAGDFIDWTSMPRNSPSIFHIHHQNDPSMLQIYLSRSHEGHIERAQNIIAERMKASGTSREQTDRAFWAKSAIFCAIASGSLDLYRDAILWARRFIRDALTVKEIYANGVVLTEEGLDMVCGIPPKRKKDALDIDKVQSDVETGNRIMLDILETACMALREPSFYLPDWRGTIHLFHRVVNRRLDRIAPLCQLPNLSDASVFKAVWADTVKTMLAAEEMGLVEGREKLQLHTLRSMIFNISVPESVASQPSVCRFIDELAAERNHLWETHRRAKYPAVLTLEEPWTRGLPIQVLRPSFFKPRGSGEHMPFLLERAKRIVFMPAKAALSRELGSEEVREAIGPFVDDYKTALRLYVQASASDDEQESRIKDAWEHAVRNLTGHRMGLADAVDYWEGVFKSLDIEPPEVRDVMKRPKRPPPVLPETDNPADPTEWNPDPKPERWIGSSYELERVRLDLFLQTPGNSNSTVDSPFKAGTPIKIYTPRQNPVWIDVQHETAVEWSRRLAPSVQEALIVMAVLLISSKRKQGPRMLAQPFPSVQDARFPALYLDEAFLERKDLDWDLGHAILEHLGREFPPSLVVNLCQAMMQELDGGETKMDNLESVTFSLIKVLTRCDRPQVALGLVMHTVLNRPDDSSWHRILLNTGLLNTLSAKTVTKFLDDLVGGVQRKLQEQKPSKSASAKENAKSAAPGVKITTLKMLAQIMSGAKFIPKYHTVNTLIGLFASSRHLDIRVAIIESLGSILRETKDECLVTIIIDALEKHAVPIAGAVNERTPMMEDLWTQAEERQEVPEVFSPEQSLQPVFQALVDATPNSPVSLTQQMVDRILLPVLHLSAANNRRWTKLFLRTLPGVSLRADDLPPLPVKTSMLGVLLDRYRDFLPCTALDMCAGASMTNLQPPAALQKTTKTILESQPLRNSNAGKHWCTLWQKQGVAALGFGGESLVPFLTMPLTPRTPGGITYDRIAELVMAQAEVLIMRADDTFSELNWLLPKLEVRPNTDQQSWMLWQHNVRPIVRRIIARIESLRTPEWQRDPDRKPAALKDTYYMKLWLMSYTNAQHDAASKDEPEAFANELRHEIHQLASNTTAYHQKFATLKTAGLKCLRVDFCYLACQLGALDPSSSAEPTLPDLLCVELADAFLRDAFHPRRPEHVGQARALLESWRASPCEEIRMRGLSTTRVLTGQKKGPAAWFHEDLEGNGQIGRVPGMGMVPGFGWLRGFAGFPG